MEVTTLGNKKSEYQNQDCTRTIKAVRDAMYLLEGKWKIPILAVLCFSRKRYSDILRGVDGISGKMLSRELKELEINKLVKRIVSDSSPVMVEYELTEYGCTFKQVVDQLAAWGSAHREEILQA